MRRLASFVVLAALLTPVPASALCAAPSMQPVVMTETSEGSIVVKTEAGYASQRKERGEAVQPTWRIKTTSGSVKPVMVELAPGLVSYQLPDKVEAGELVDGTKVLGKLTRAKGSIAKLAAPAPTKITYKETPNRRGSIVDVAAQFGAIPADAIALIVVDAATKKPRSYGLVTAGSLAIQVYFQGRCIALPNGTVPTVAGDKVIVRWVDKTGVVSADSKPIVVAKA